MERHWMMEKAERGREWLTDLLFPRRCPVCGKIVVPKGGLICPGCVKKLSFVTVAELLGGEGHAQGHPGLGQEGEKYRPPYASYNNACGAERN